MDTILNVGVNYHLRRGSDRYMLALGELLRGRGHEVIPFAARQDRDLDTPWREHFPPGADVDRPKLLDPLRFVFNARARAQLRRLLEGRSIDVAHLHIYYGKLTASILLPLVRAGVPVVQTLHDFKPVCPVHSLVSNGEFCEACRGGRFWHALAKRCNRGSVTRSALSTVESYVAARLGSVAAVDRFISVCEFQRRKLVAMGLPESKITTVPNFVDTHALEPAERPGKHLLYSGAVERSKGLFTLLDAAAHLPDVPLVIAGVGGDRRELEALARERGLEHVRFVGFQGPKDMGRLVRDSICLVLPSEAYELCPMSILESFAYGRPVVATRTGGTPELVRDGVDGYLVPRGEVEPLRERLAWMARNPEDALALGAEARRAAEERFGPERHYEALRSVYRALR